jgi:leucine dehydrogenase
MGEKVKERGILYAPDYVINGGGIINVAAEIAGAYDMAWVDGKVTRLMETLGEVLDQAQREGKATNRVADAIARLRIGR